MLDIQQNINYIRLVNDIHNIGKEIRKVTDTIALKEVIKSSGVSITHIAEKMGCSRNRVYAIMNGSDCTAKEITLITECLHLSREKRDSIFFATISE